MSVRAASILRLLALPLGALLCSAYFVWQWLEPHGPGEFAYNPFTTEPLPYSPMRGFTYEQLWGHLRRIALMGPGLCLLVWGLAPRVRLAAPGTLRRGMWLSAALCLLLTALLMLGVLKGRALIDDELAYAMQARFFSSGRLTGIDLGVNPADPFTVPTQLGYTAKYLPGEGLMQIPGVALGIPALMHLPCVAVTLWAWYQCLRRSSGQRIAELGTIALGCSPMLAFTGATGLSHASALMWLTLMGLGTQLARAGQVLPGVTLAGLSFAMGFATRPQSLLPAGAVLGLALLLTLFKSRAWAGLALLVVLGSGGCAALFWYNHALTGSPWRLPWFLQCNAEHYGFGRVWRLNLYEHTLARALENLAVVALRLNAWWLGLPLSLGVLGAWLAWGRRAHGAGLWLAVGGAILLFEFFYYSPGVSETGAIYHFELLLPGSLMAAAVADVVLSRFAFGPLLLASSLGIGTSSWVVEQGLRLHRLVELIHHDSDSALARINGPALLIHEVRPSEVVSRGWVGDSFPRRFRGVGDAIVTVPRVTPDMVARAERAYPGRSCWYYRYLPGTAAAELKRCSEVKELLARPIVDPPETRTFVVNSTAYYKTDYLPAQAIARSLLRGQDGKPLHACCGVRATQALGLVVKPEIVKSCVETGEP